MHASLWDLKLSRRWECRWWFCGLCLLTVFLEVINTSVERLAPIFRVEVTMMLNMEVTRSFEISESLTSPLPFRLPLRISRCSWICIAYSLHYVFIYIHAYKHSRRYFLMVGCPISYLADLGYETPSDQRLSWLRWSRFLPDTPCKCGCSNLKQGTTNYCHIHILAFTYIFTHKRSYWYGYLCKSLCSFKHSRCAVFVVAYSLLRMEAVCSSKTVVSTYKSTWC